MVSARLSDPDWLTGVGVGVNFLESTCNHSTPTYSNLIQEYETPESIQCFLVRLISRIRTIPVEL